MVSIPLVQRINTASLDWEKVARALLEYGGIPLALFMAVGIVVSILQGYGVYYPFIDPMQNYYLFFVINVWIVAGIYLYRQRYQQSLLLSTRKELAVAAIAAFTWVATQPLYLLVGYVFYMIAVMRQDTLHSSFLPDIEEITANDEEERSDAWGHLESVKDNMT